MPCTLRRSTVARAHRDGRLGPGRSAAPDDDRLVLLPSGPDTVRGSPLRGTRSSTSHRRAATENGDLERGFSPAGADCRLQGTASSPPSTAREGYAEWPTRRDPARRRGGVIRAGIDGSTGASHVVIDAWFDVAADRSRAVILPSPHRSPAAAGFRPWGTGPGRGIASDRGRIGSHPRQVAAVWPVRDRQPPCPDTSLQAST